MPICRTRARARTLVVAIVVIALFATACGRGDDPALIEREGDGAAATTPTGDDGSETAADDGSDNGGDGANGAGTAAGGGDSGGATSGSAGASAPSGGGGESHSTTGDGQQAAPQPTAPGRYTYDVEGEIRAGELNQPLPPEAILDVEPVQGSDQRSVTTHGGQESEQVLRFGTGGVHLVSQRSSGQGGNLEFRPDPPVLVFPAQPAEGATWSWTMTSTDGSTTVKADLRILRRETITVAGTSVDTWVLEILMTISGQISATSETIAWVSPEHRLRVQEETTIKGTFGEIPFEGDERRVIRSLTPA